MQKQFYNIKTLAKEIGISKNSFRIALNIMLSDETLRKEFGRYRFKRFTRVQYNLIVKNIPEADHLPEWNIQ